MNESTLQRINNSDKAARLERLSPPESVQNTKAYRAGGTELRKAYCIGYAPASNIMPCYLDSPPPAPGAQVEVTCRIYGGNYLNAAVPRLEPYSLIRVFKNEDGDWECIIGFQGVEACDCYTA
jgi:hypothetical protein